MDYFSILHLEKEPFSNSPDPSFFFKSRQHQDCLQKIELALRLRRGLNVVMGDVGTGKTTLCRQLIRRFREEETVDTHLILDPAFDTPGEFLSAVAGMFSQRAIDPEADTWQLKEQIKKRLYKSGVDEGRTVILIFDEGQKLPAFVIELLREFLNYETNTHKLLQIAIFAQCEFEAILAAHANFADRVNLLHRLEPMSFKDTREMIRYRLKQSSTSPKPLPLFTYPAMWAIYRFSQGYPRKIINLCHQSMLAMIIQNRTRASLMLVRSCVQRAISHPSRRFWRPLTSLLLVLLVVVAIGVWLPEPYSPISHLASGLKSQPWISVHPVSSKKEAPNSAERVDAGEAKAFPGKLSGNRMDASGNLNPIDGKRSQTNFSAMPVGDAPFMEEPMAVSPPDQILPSSTPPPSLDPSATTGRDDSADTGTRFIHNEALGSEVSDTSTGTDPLAGHPLLLGRLEVASGDTLARLVRRIRGNNDPNYMERLLALNPHIKDPDDIGIGDEIIFPATPVRISRLIEQTHWLQLAETRSLNEAHRHVNRYRSLGIEVRLVPYWTAMEGLRFVVLATGAHVSPEAAQLRMGALPAEVSTHSRIRSHWGRKPVFFSSPF
jgi:general secretion pathway protein A